MWGGGIKEKSSLLKDLLWLQNAESKGLLLLSDVILIKKTTGTKIYHHYFPSSLFISSCVIFLIAFIAFMWLHDIIILIFALSIC